MTFKKQNLQQEYNRSKEIRKHFRGERSESFDRIKLRDEMRENLGFLIYELQQARRGNIQVNGVLMAGSNRSFNELLYDRYGIEPDKDSDGKVVKAPFQKYLESLGVYSAEMSLNDMAVSFGLDALSKTSVDKMLLEHGAFSAPRSTGDVADDYRFLIPELIVEAIRTNYQHVAQHNNWTAATRNINKLKVTMPQIRQSRAMPTRIFEGSTVPFGQVTYGQKDVTVYKIGIGLELTEELIIQSAISDLFVFLADVGSNIAIGSDWEGLLVLSDGDQTDGSESAPVIGVNNTTTGIDRPDLIRIASRMQRLGLTPSRLITSEAQAIRNINEAATTGDYMTMLQFINQTFPMGQDIHALSNDRVMLLNQLRAMIKLQFGAMRVRSEEDIETQKLRTVITDYIGFAKVKRDAAVILDGSVAYSDTVGAAGAFPAYMDIDSMLAQAFSDAA